MRRLTALCLLLVCTSVHAQDDAGLGLGDATSLLQGATPQSLADMLLPSLGASMGLPPKHHVAVAEASRESLRAVLLDVMQRQYPGNLLDRMNEAYQLIGLVPHSVDLRNEALRLYQGQIAGFYDPSNGRMVLVSGSSPMQAAQILQHELAHALQDQYFGLQKLIDGVVRDEDQALAMQAVIEGQAVVAMFAGVTAMQGDAAGTSVEGAAAALRAAGMDVSDEEVRSMVNVGKGGGDADPSLAQFMVPEKAPADSVPYLQAQLLFPYQEGTRFMESMMRRGSFASAIRRTLTAPPRSTAQILHPELYGKRQPVAMRLPHFATAGRSVFDTTVGELNIRTLLGSDVAAGWRGDHLAALVVAGQSKPVVGWASAWGSESEATAFAAGMRAILGARGSSVSDANYTYDGAMDAVRQRGARVVVLAGARASETAGLLAALVQDVE